MNYYETISTLVGKENVLEQESMARHVTFGVGGPARYYVIPHTLGQVSGLIAICHKYNEPYYILGNGSNLIVSDEGYPGTVIQIWNNLSGYEIRDNVVTAEAGMMLGKLASLLPPLNLAGFEFASGIPGTLGGAVVMNAGAYGGEMKDVLLGVHVSDEEGHEMILSADELELGYRTSCLPRKGYVVLRARLQLKPGHKEEILELMRDYNGRRRSKQPLEYPSAGSTFKRPEGQFAGKLIADAGLKGFSVGGAQVSEKHAGFVINTGGATCQDILELIRQVKERVYADSGVLLEEEVKLLK